MINVGWLEAGASQSRHFKPFYFWARRGIKKSLSLWSVRDKASIINSSRTGGLFARAVFYAGGFLVKPRQTPGGMIHFWGDFSLSFSAHHGGGCSRNLASHRPSQAFSFLRGPAFLFCGNLLSLDRENSFAQAFIFPGWSLHSGSRSDRAGPGLGRGMWGCMIHSYVIGRGNTATAYLQAGMIRPVPGATADAVVDVQGGSGRRVPSQPA